MSQQQQVSSKRQQDLQTQYSMYKNNLQTLAQKIGDIEQETEEHKYEHVISSCYNAPKNLLEVCTKAFQGVAVAVHAVLAFRNFCSPLGWLFEKNALKLSRYVIFAFLRFFKYVLLTAFVFAWYRLVLETLDPLPDERKCFRMVNGVLVERTVKDVKPALKTNSEGLKQVLDQLVKEYKKQQDDMEKWKKKNNIQVVQQ